MKEKIKFYKDLNKIYSSTSKWQLLKEPNLPEQNFLSGKSLVLISIKDIQIILRLFLVIAMYCQASSSQFFSITQPLPLLAGWEGSLGTCSR